MTPGQWADVFLAGRRAIPDNGGTPAQVLSAILLAMSHKASQIEDETSVDHPAAAVDPPVRAVQITGGVTLPGDAHGHPTVPMPYGDRCHCTDAGGVVETVRGRCIICGGLL